MEAVCEGFVSCIQKKWHYGFYAIKNSSGDFLSAIFGISVKFHVDIGVQKNSKYFFRGEKKSQEIFFWEFLKFLIFFEKSQNSIRILHKSQYFKY